MTTYRFGFTAVDEQFTYGLYANWDNFCHACVEKVVEECLSVYDKEKVLHEIELLDLDLGDILEEDFYQEFPRRLRDKLQRALPLLNISAGNREESTGISRLQNLLFYLVRLSESGMVGRKFQPGRRTGMDSDTIINLHQ